VGGKKEKKAGKPQEVRKMNKGYSEELACVYAEIAESAIENARGMGYEIPDGHELRQLNYACMHGRGRGNTSIHEIPAQPALCMQGVHG